MQREPEACWINEPQARRSIRPKVCRTLAGGNAPGLRSMSDKHPGRGAGSSAVSRAFPAPLPGCIPFFHTIRGCYPRLISEQPSGLRAASSNYRFKQKGFMRERRSRDADESSAGKRVRGNAARGYAVRVLATDSAAAGSDTAQNSTRRSCPHARCRRLVGAKFGGATLLSLASLIAESFINHFCETQ